jgi:hypothetical protein
MGGTLDLSSRSPLIKKIQEIFPEGGVASQIIKNIQAHASQLANSMPDVFYFLGASEMNIDANYVEQVRGDKPYNSLPIGSEARKAYERVVQHGVLLAHRDYRDQTWHEVIGSLLERQRK